jgi:transcriptional regulator with XRE-family HTH domain
MASLQNLADAAVLKTLGERLAQRRLDRNLTQAHLARHAGVARGAVQRLELGEPVTTVTLIRVMRALDALDELDSGIPELGPSPLQALERQRGQRKRASGRRSEPRPRDGEFRWGRD